MKIFFLETVPNVGEKHTVKEVADGYAKNFLIRKNLALAYNDANQPVIDRILRQAQSVENEAILDATLLKAEIEKLHLRFVQKTHNNKLFGHITHHDIIVALQERGLSVTKFHFTDHAKYDIGDHDVVFKLSKTITAVLKITVTAEEH